MWDVLSALLPPAVVATVFCTIVYTVLRKEMAPRTSDGRLVKEADAEDVDSTSGVAPEDGAKSALASPGELPGSQQGPEDR
ncbi:hypothetical protein Nans01_17330 [Nocardiopsis ansamitocini]|uniref:Uncharacterized protein n=1 Tax=Nocardiopsis ansamitocini TaxID=1670832 RepID=A0A9W6P5C4_9ACTN|nr:hypothetical protein [Nocardiopsis ansamitocini]GLU47382.1 hypothetical protein Nans01_17330 [Nocardiopsis ansamitocini]